MEFLSIPELMNYYMMLYLLRLGVLIPNPKSRVSTFALANSTSQTVFTTTDGSHLASLKAYLTINHLTAPKIQPAVRVTPLTFKDIILLSTILV
jgi:hypothetical protein